MTFNEISLQTNVVDVILEDGSTLDSKIEELENHKHGLSDNQLYLELPNKTDDAAYTWSEIMNKYCENKERKILKFISANNVSFGSTDTPDGPFSGLVFRCKDSICTYETFISHRYADRVGFNIGYGYPSKLYKISVMGTSNKEYDLDTLDKINTGLENGNLTLNLWDESKTWKDMLSSLRDPLMNTGFKMAIIKNGLTNLEPWQIYNSSSLVFSTSASHSIGISFASKGSGPDATKGSRVKFVFGNYSDIEDTFTIQGTNNKVYNLESIENIDLSCYMHQTTIGNMADTYPAQWNEILPNREFGMKIISRVQTSAKLPWAMGFSTGLMVRSMNITHDRADTTMSIFMTSYEKEKGIIFASGSIDECRYSFRLVGENEGVYDLSSYDTSITTINQNLTRHNTAIGDINERLNTYNTSIENLKTDVSSTQKSIQTHSVRLSELNTKTTSHDTSIENINKSLSSVDSMKQKLNQIENDDIAITLNSDNTWESVFPKNSFVKNTLHIFDCSNSAVPDWSLKYSSGIVFGKYAKSGMFISYTSSKATVKFLSASTSSIAPCCFTLTGTNDITYDLDKYDKISQITNNNIFVEAKTQDNTWESIIDNNLKSKNTFHIVDGDTFSSYYPEWTLKKSSGIIFGKNIKSGIVISRYTETKPSVKFFCKNYSTDDFAHFTLTGATGGNYDLDSVDTGLSGKMYWNIENANSDFTWKDLMKEVSVLSSTGKGTLKVLNFGRNTSTEKWMLSFSAGLMFHASPYTYGIIMDSNKVRFFRKSTSSAQKYFDIKATDDKVYDLDVLSKEPNSEYFEWAESTTIYYNRFVTLEAGKIRLATEEDDYILGVALREENGKALVKLLGIVSVSDNGTCVQDGYCYPANAGIASSCEDKTKGYKVFTRKYSSQVEIILK